MNDIALNIEGIGKRYDIGRSGGGPNSLRDAIVEGWHALLHPRSRMRQPGGKFWALNDVNPRIVRGERVGIIGLNGAGKSTLLKVLARIVEPTTGSARIAGRVGALLEVGTGFHWELTGRENLFLYGAILGMTRAEIVRKCDAIIGFSGVREFIDVPVKRYSSGMYVRLAFAVAAHLEPEILFIDEVLSVGDLPFQRKCIDFAKGLQGGKATILFASHNMFSIKAMCSRVIYLSKGRVVFDGPTDEGLELYEKDCMLSTLAWVEDDPEKWPVMITGIALFNDAGKQITVFDHGERMKLRLKYQTRRELDRPNFIVAFIRSDGVACCNFSTALDAASPHDLEGNGVLQLVTPPLKLVAEMYTISILVRERGFDDVVCGQIGSTFHVRHGELDSHFGVFHEPGIWTWNDGAEAANDESALKLNDG